MGKIIIDCDAAPFIPEGCEIRPEDQLPGAVGGMLEFDSAKILLHLDECQKGGYYNGKFIIGYDLKERLAGKSVLKASVLDHLLANTNLIPESWKTDVQGEFRRVYFWGTVYRMSGGGLECVRYLRWWGVEWLSFHHHLDGKFFDQDLTAILVG